MENPVQDFDPTITDIDMSIADEPFQYLDPLLDKIKNINIKDFDEESFMKYFDELDVKDFMSIYDEKIVPVIKHVNDKYLNLDIDAYDQATDSEKQVIFTEQMEFLMFTLPYEIVFPKYFNRTFSSLKDLSSWLDNKNISNDLELLIQDSIIVMNKTYNHIKNEMEASRRKYDEGEAHISKLKDYLDHTIQVTQYFIDMIIATEQEQLHELLMSYYASEYL